MTLTIEKIREHKRIRIQDAVDSALNEMPNGFVIRMFLMEHRSEVRGIIDTEYNEAEVMKASRTRAVLKDMQRVLQRDVRRVLQKAKPPS